MQLVQIWYCYILLVKLTLLHSVVTSVPSIIVCCWGGHSEFLLFSVVLTSFAFSFPAHALGLCLKNKRKLDSPLLNYIEVLPTLVFHQLQPPQVCGLESRTSLSGYVWNLTVCVMSSGVQCCLPHSEQSKELSMPLIPATFLLAYTQLFGILGFTFCLLNSH